MQNYGTDSKFTWKTIYCHAESRDNLCMNEELTILGNDEGCFGCVIGNDGILCYTVWALSRLREVISPSVYMAPRREDYLEPSLKTQGWFVCRLEDAALPSAVLMRPSVDPF